ncbi:Arsenical-resistance protein ACR3 [Edwardsiella anguillarum]|nr:Arsenical-resistance protein ACR3 [Edwardsiella anguillarum]BET84943.1 Arsenical-resistance protein ACR3 [Edwardsiella anguillarum]BET88308.1 Arsenical-resistance protein ACR3 [Edwardsiella anguillarum]BET91599.1 Arsenical-resistance protein ACR3 [Edwardsiella anguillarum]
MNAMRDWLEQRQITLYFSVILLAALLAYSVPAAGERLSAAMTPALALMLYATFLQMPLAELRRALHHPRFLLPLFLTQFLLIPALVALLLPFLPHDPLLRLGVLLVLLSPCIDYVVTFAQLGRADARLLLAATPLLLLAQALLLPLYLRLFLGEQAADVIRPTPFIEAFIGLIVLPLGLAALTQRVCRRGRGGQAIAGGLSLLPVPATALVLGIVVAATLPPLRDTISRVWPVIPLYLIFAVVAPLIGWAVARLCRLEAPAGRALAFSAATRNSLVVLPLALAVPGATPLLPAVIVAQTIVELASELMYIRLIPRLGARDKEAGRAS